MISNYRRRIQPRGSSQPLLRSLGLQVLPLLSNLRTLRKSFPTDISIAISATKSATRRVSLFPSRSASNLDCLRVHCPPTEVISCTEATKKCKTKYCKPCLANRYGEEIDEIRKTPPSGRGKSKMQYTFKFVFSEHLHPAAR